MALNYMFEERLKNEPDMTTERKFELAFDFLDQMRDLNNEIKHYYG